MRDPGGNLALRLLLEHDGASVSSSIADDGWASGFLRDCRQLAEASLIPGHVETGFMRMVGDDDGRIDAWVATRRAPAAWRERADIAWWASWLLRGIDPWTPEGFLRANSPVTTADGLIASMEYQLGYPDDASIGGYSIQLAVEVVRQLIVRTLRDGDGAVWAASELTQGIAREIGSDVDDVRETTGALTLDRENAAWHAAVPGIAAAPLVRLGPDRVVLSRFGLTTEPLLFLTRELRRRDPETYHNAAHAREGVFRQDLYALFADKRFVTSEGRIRLRHDDGKMRTDIDAAIFDRKTGTLGVFELKSQDPFARSTAALQRQRDNLLYANRQVSGVLDWLNRNGANEILGRIDARTARTFRVQKVYPFVLGRFLARFDDGATPDRRAAWGTWPGVLRVIEDAQIRPTDANPIATLFSRLSIDEPPIPPPEAMPAREIRFGETRIVVHPGWAAFQAAGSE